jgi:hypothetical protein
MRYVKPIIAPKKEVKELETILRWIFASVLRKIHFETFQEPNLKLNSRSDYDALINAFRTGELYYDNGLEIGRAHV